MTALKSRRSSRDISSYNRRQRGRPGVFGRAAGCIDGSLLQAALDDEASTSSFRPPPRNRRSSVDVMAWSFAVCSWPLLRSLTNWRFSGRISRIAAKPLVERPRISQNDTLPAIVSPRQVEANQQVHEKAISASVEAPAPIAKSIDRFLCVLFHSIDPRASLCIYVRCSAGQTGQGYGRTTIGAGQSFRFSYSSFNLLRR